MIVVPATHGGAAPRIARSILAMRILNQTGGARKGGDGLSGAYRNAAPSVMVRIAGAAAKERQDNRGSAG
jgi:hypothetical protein